MSLPRLVEASHQLLAPAVALSNIQRHFTESAFFQPLLDRLPTLEAARDALRVRGLSGSLPAFLLQALEPKGTLTVAVLPAHEAATYLRSDLEQLGAFADRMLLLPPSGQKPYDDGQMPDLAPLIQRAEAIEALVEGFSGLLVTSAEALFELVPTPEQVQQDVITLQVGHAEAPDALAGRLGMLGFQRVEFVEEPGDVALRGGILDVFPFAGEYPLRFEFFGDEIESVREFDVRTQRSISRLSSARIVPRLERADRGVPHTAIFDYFPADALLVLFDEAQLRAVLDRCFDEARQAHERAMQAGEAVSAPEARYLNPDTLLAALHTRPRLLLGTFAGATPATVTFESRPQPAFNANLERLRLQIHQHAAAGTTTYLLCDSRAQESRLFDLLEAEVTSGQARLSVTSLHEGFEVPSLGLAVYTDHQIFGRYHRPTARHRKRLHGGLSLREIQNLTPGDFVVHVDYGIGRFVGTERITVRDKQQEAVRLIFQDGDVLYVNVNALHKLHKYTGKEGHQPRLTKLGSGQWERTKARAKKRVKDIARDLIRLYAQRKASSGFAFSPDSVWQRELEAAFPYEDTPDQAASAESVKQDMEQPIPMDRLVCGDVGFGKTEVAVRAAFKAVQDGKQVALLVPTTILAAQHHVTFSRRMGAFPVRIEVLSRFRSATEQKEILQKTASGEVDILIGTHRLLSKDVTFKNLGLLIIDEEQRFGVASKERLRKLRTNVDTLTLTATPIPRTLQFSLLGARDLSIITTPPPNRQPIVTEIHTFNKDLIRDAILYEVSRQGQVFFIHNRVQSIHETAAMLRAIVPDVRIRVAHGQMKAGELEDVMMAFIEHKFDVLVSTNLIESGLDISNANTIIINHAERFGLSELHQLRGRVGRSDRKAFAYLLVPSIQGLTREARQRLQAVEEFSDLGSGFNIAMRDLDIRGAGSLLGAEQSGFIEDVGFETYHKILDEAVQELRQEEFSDVFETSPAPRADETTIDVDADAYIPESYVSNNIERLNLYRRISEAEDALALDTLRQELHDRFGALPPEVDNLLTAAEIKLLAQALRIQKVTFKNERLFFTFPAPGEDAFFYEHFFHPLLERFAHLDRRYVLRETDKKGLKVIVQAVGDLGMAREVVGALQREAAPA